MKHFKASSILILTITLLMILAAIPAYAEDEDISLSPKKGDIDDKITVTGSDYEPGGRVYIYLSSHEAEVDDEIEDLNAYEQVVKTSAGDLGDPDEGEIDTFFRVPYQLTDGEDIEYVHGGDYYVYAAYRGDPTIVAVAQFTVIGGEIEISPEEGYAGSEVEISGNKFVANQQITIEYDGDDIEIASGASEVDINGEFTSTIIIPESTAGAHTITASDEAGNESEVEFSVEPEVTLDPASGSVGDEITVSGTGFNDDEHITITVDSYRVATTPLFINTDRNGSFSASFSVPSHVTIGTSKIGARGETINRADADLTVVPGISLYPITSQTSPGHVGMELAVHGTGFSSGDEFTITYDDTEVGAAIADSAGNFRATFTVPPGIAGDHNVAATDGTLIFSDTFVLEAEAPPTPMPQLPELAATVEGEVYLDWSDVTDPSGVTYTLQIGTDDNFTTIVLEKEGLVDSEYTTEERLEPAEANTPYYWRIRAVDGASNEGKWAIPMLFYIGSPSPLMPGWTIYIWIGLGVVLLAIIGFRLRRRIRQR